MDITTQTEPSAGLRKGVVTTHTFKRHAEDKSRHSITIARSPEEVYAFWRKLENLATFMKDVKEITETSADESHWVVKLKVGGEAEWDARITADSPGKMIAWQSSVDSTVQTSGSVFFYPAPQGLGTIVSLGMDYQVPGGVITEFLTKFTGEDPDTLILTNLKRLKGILETGEIATIEGQTSGRAEDQDSPTLQ